MAELKPTSQLSECVLSTLSGIIYRNSIKYIFFDQAEIISRFEHKKIIEKLTSLDDLPSDEKTLLSWVKADDHIRFLIDNARYQEMEIYTSPEYSFIHSIAVPENLLEPLDKDDSMIFQGSRLVIVFQRV